MLKLLFNLILSSILIGTANAQITSGSNVETGGATDQSNAIKPTDWNALIIAFNMPIGAFGKTDSSLPFERAVGAKPGVYIGYEGNRYFKSTANDPLKTGLNWGINSSLNQVNWDSWGLGEGKYTPFGVFGLNIGVIGSFEIDRNLKGDIFLRFGGRFGIGGTATWPNGFLELKSPGLGINAEFGLNVRYRSILGTLRTNPGAMSYKYLIATSNDDSITTYKLPSSTVQLGFGFVF